MTTVFPALAYQGMSMLLWSLKTLTDTLKVPVLISIALQVILASVVETASYYNHHQ
jgi:hypothetical protein